MRAAAELGEGPARRVRLGPRRRRRGARWIVSAAFFAAMPFRSAPDEAAVAEVLGTLSVRVALTFTALDRHGEDVRHHLGDLDHQPLAHFGAAMVQVDRAVGIDQHQRAGLVEMGGGEADPELHRGQREALLEDVVAGVERLHRGAARGIARAFGQLGDQLRRDIVGDLHVIGRHVAAGAVEIGLADVERIAAELRRRSRPSPARSPSSPAARRSRGRRCWRRCGSSAGARRSRPRADNSNCRRGTWRGR